MHRKSFGRLLPLFFDLYHSGGFRGRYRISLLANLRQIFFLKQQRRQGRAHMPFHVVGQQAEENMRTHMLLGTQIASTVIPRTIPDTSQPHTFIARRNLLPKLKRLALAEFAYSP